MTKITITLSEVRETPASKPKVVMDWELTGKLAQSRDSHLYRVAMDAIDFIDKRRKDTLQ